MDIRGVVFIGCSCVLAFAVYKKIEIKPREVMIPVYQYDRDHDKRYIHAVEKLSERDRQLLNGFLGMSAVTGTPVDSGITIGSAVTMQEQYIGSFSGGL